LIAPFDQASRKMGSIQPSVIGDVDDVGNESRARRIGQIEDRRQQEKVGHSGEPVHHGEAVHRRFPGQFNPVDRRGLAIRAERRRRHPEVAAVGALRGNQAPLFGGFPEGFGGVVDGDPDVLARDGGRQRGGR
jgi:hypothetical protein